MRRGLPWASPFDRAGLTKGYGGKFTLRGWHAFLRGVDEDSNKVYKGVVLPTNGQPGGGQQYYCIMFYKVFRIYAGRLFLFWFGKAMDIELSWPPCHQHLTDRRGSNGSWYVPFLIPEADGIDTLATKFVIFVVFIPVGLSSYNSEPNTHVSFSLQQNIIIIA
jgi:hypothetical protein